MIAIAIFPFRRLLAGVVVRVVSYVIWSLNLVGSIIPQQVLWLCLLIALLYIAVGSFYGKRLESGAAPKNASPVIGPVETMTRWIEERQRGTYFKWQIANLLGKVHKSIEETDGRGTSNRVPHPLPQVQSFLDAGVNTTYADYPYPGLFQKAEPTPFDIPLEQVVEYLEEQMEIRDER
jgi:hypothetical protein